MTDRPATDPGIEVLPSLPRDDDGPVFAEPWQAQAFAMAVRLHELGHFTWDAWATELSGQIAASELTSAPDGRIDDSIANQHGHLYYEHWLATLEVMVTSHGLTSREELGDRRDAWRAAAERTPHGRPIEL